MTVIDRIIKDHQHMSRLLDYLDREMSCYREDSRRSPRLNCIQEALDYLYKYPDAFHHPLESCLMARLRPRLERNEDRIQFDLIEDQHQQITALTQKLNEDFARIASDAVMPANLLLAEYALYSELQRDHMAQENRFMIPAMQALLNEDDLAQVEDDLKQTTDPLFGTHLWETYENLYQHLIEQENSFAVV